MRLENGNKVCIIGGGPAGSFAAMHLLAQARQAGLSLEVMIFEPRRANRTDGLGRCKGCAGIVSANGVSAIESLGIRIPPEVIQTEIDEYILHMHGISQPIQQPHPGRRILSIYRGNGPCRHTGEPIASFDEFLCGEAVARGATLVPERVQKVDWVERPVVCTSFRSVKADLVVLALGVNSHVHLSPVIDYAPPPTETMAQDEIQTPKAWIPHAVSVFFGEPEWLIFGAMVPKGRYVNISLLGKNMSRTAVADFLQVHEADIGGKPAVAEGWCGCTPKVPVQPARTCYGDRWVAVGESAVSRLYKDGIYSAHQTAGWAMRCAVERGIDSEAWKEGYELHYRRMISDNRYGEILFDISPHIFKNRRLANACFSCLRKEEKLPAEEKNYSRFFWGVLTGDESYRDLFGLFLAPGGLAELGREIIRPEKLEA